MSAFEGIGLGLSVGISAGLLIGEWLAKSFWFEAGRMDAKLERLEHEAGIAHTPESRP